jgi:hypothetical protein
LQSVHGLIKFLPARSQYKGFIWKAYQALALDEKRASFEPTLLYYPELPKPSDTGDLDQLEDGDEKSKKKAELEEEFDLPDEGTHFEQVWFPGVHTDVGGGYERAYRDISDISFAYMLGRMLGNGIDIDRTFLELFKEKSLYPERKQDESAPEDLGWGLSALHDEMKGSFAYTVAGGIVRKPGQYYVAERWTTPKGKKVPYVTNEYMHPSVRLRRIKLKEKWQPEALAGFKLKLRPEEETNQPDDWVWEKQVKIDKKIVTVTIPEYNIHNFLPPTEEDSAGYDDPLEYLEGRMLTPEDIAILQDKAVSNSVPAVPLS